MLIPLEHAGAHPLVRVESRDGQLCGRWVVGNSGFISARGALARQGRSAPGLHVAAGAAIYEPPCGGATAAVNPSPVATSPASSSTLGCSWRCATGVRSVVLLRSR